MPRDPRPIPPEQLYLRRLAARAIALVLDGYGLGAITLKLDPDDTGQCLPGLDEGEVIFGEAITRTWLPIATVYIHGSSARVIVERIDRLVRPNHLRDFEPEEVGIFPRPGQPDIDAEVSLAEVIEAEGDLFKTAPQRRRPPAPPPWRKPAVILSNGRIKEE